MDFERFTEVFVVHLAVGLGFDHDVSHVEEAEVFADGVVGVFGVVGDAFGHEFSCEVQSVEVTFGPAVGDVTPEVFFGCVQEFCEPVENFAFHVSRVDVVGGWSEGVADVVDGLGEELKEG